MKFSIAVGKSRLDKKWQNKQVTWDMFVNKVRETHRTVETLEEYLSFKKSRQDEIKDIGGFVGGHLSGGRRLASAVTTRSMLTFDADEADKDFWERFCIQYDCAAVLYSTHKHNPEKPRFRLVLPLSREVLCDEYTAIVRRIAGELGIEQFDHTGYQPHRLMYWPSTSKDAEFVFREQKGTFLNPDEILATYKDWQDVSEWPTGSRERKNLFIEAKKQGEPTEKPGLIGAFNRQYTIHEAIELFLSDVYEKCDADDRYTFKEGSTSAGVIIYDDKFSFSHHSTDPTSGILCNAFDLVRIHKFGIQDLDSGEDTPINKKPSYLQMCDFVSTNPLIRKQLGEAKIESARAAFAFDIDDEEDEFSNSEEENLDWLKDMDVDRKGNHLPTLNNIALILEHDQIFKNNIAYDSFKQQPIFRKNVPWRKVKGRQAINDNDLANIENYIEKVYNIQSSAKLTKGLLIVLEKQSFHPIVDYLKSLKWDKQKRVDELMIKYLGAAPSEYTKVVTRKSLVACVARVIEPGVKFDYVLTLIGDEGQGKSQLFDRLGGEWFSDTFNLHMLKGKEAYEQIQGVWIIEIGELSGMAKAEIERVKGFIAARKDLYRSPYARTTEDRLRQCVFFATSNNRTPLRSQTGNRRFWPVSTYEIEPQKSVYEMTRDEVDQIWAEAVYYYEQGEKLYLDKDMIEEAKKVQQEYTEENPLVQMIEDYLQYKIPENWYKMSKWEKREFIAEYDASKPDLVTRTNICIYEIWEMVLEKKEAIDAYGAKVIKEAMDQVKGWARNSENIRFGTSYPRHKGSYEKVVTVSELIS